MTTSATGQHGRVFALAAAHLRHEWVLTLCLVSALAAVLAPLLVLMGLKEGTVETLRERLVQDPQFREIRPAMTRTFDRAWFDALVGDDAVAFVLPTILPASSVIQLGSDAEATELVDLVPSAAGDPLLLENGGTIPAEGETVLSGEAARRLGVAAGDHVSARVTRSRGGRIEAVSEPLRVAAVLDARAGSLARAYTTLDFVLDVEAYKEGRGVARRDWPGDLARPHLSYQGALVVTRQVLDPVTRTGLSVNTGMLGSDPLDAAGFHDLTGLPLPAGWHAYRVSVPRGSVTLSSVKALTRKLRGHDALVLPYATGIGLKLASRDLELTGLSISSGQAQRWGWPALPWDGFDPAGSAAGRLLRLALPDGGGEPVDGMFDARFAGVAEIVLPLKVETVAGIGRPLVPAELLGMLNTARERPVLYSAAQGELVLGRAGFRGFRLYAQRIDDVPALVARLRSEGIEVIAEVEAIERIRVLDRGLSRLFWLIALLGVAGAAAVLVASLYAAVERERRDLGVLRLVGLSRADVFWFPLFQGGLMALFAVLVALLGYAGLAAVINRVFANDLMGGEAICRLAAPHLWAAAGVTVLLALVSSLFAAWRATLIEPAEAIREE